MGASLDFRAPRKVSFQNSRLEACRARLDETLAGSTSHMPPSIHLSVLGPEKHVYENLPKMFLKYKLSKSSIQVSPHPDILQTWAPLLWLFSVLLLVKNL